jgi:hypothetical protein
MTSVASGKDADLIALIERTTRASGVPVRVDDPATLENVAEILRGDDDRA